MERKLKCEKLWVNIDATGFAKNVSTPSHGPSVTHQYIENQDPQTGYLGRSNGAAVIREKLDAKLDAY